MKSLIKVFFKGLILLFLIGNETAFSKNLESVYCRSVFSDEIVPVAKWDVKNFLKPYREYTKVKVKTEGDPKRLFSEALKHLNIQVDHNVDRLNSIPKEGPLVVVANHPLGAIDGVILYHLLFQVRPDVKAFISKVLYDAVPELRPFSFPVDVSDFKSFRNYNNSPAVKMARAHVEAGGALVIFPAGEISTAEYPWRTAFDPKWKLTAADIILNSSANVVPVYFDGQNSGLFQTTGMMIKKNRPTWIKKLGYALRGIMVPFEILNKKDQSIRVEIGKVIDAETYAPYRKKLDKEGALTNDKKGFTDYLRAKVYLLGDTKKYTIPGSLNLNIVHRIKDKLKKSKNTKLEEIIKPVPVEMIQSEVERLRAYDNNGILTPIGTRYELFRTTVSRKTKGDVKNIDISIFVMPGTESNTLLTEIARLREHAFRTVNEGSGKSLDTDRFDPFYYQMFVYRNDTQEITGAYRLGFVNEILSQGSIDDIYTHSLFNYHPNFLQKLGYGVELGRSFVTNDYQMGQPKAKELGTRVSVMKLLWVGLTELAYQNGKIQAFFGPVTISGNYPQSEKKLMLKFLMKKHGDKNGEYVNLVPDYGKMEEQTWLSDNEMSSVLKSLESISDVDQFFDSVGKSKVPVLVKHYAEQGAQFVAFKDDKDFNTGDTPTFATDGLIVTKIKNIPRPILEKLIGEEKADQLLNSLNQ